MDHRSTSRYCFLFLLALGILCPTAAGAQTEPGAETYPEEAVEADLRHLYATLRESHYDLFAHTSPAAYDSVYREALREIDGPMTRLEAARLFMPFVAAGNVGHASVAFPVPEYIEYAQAGGTLIPLDIRVYEGRPLIAHAYRPDPALEPGTEVRAINGLSVEEWLRRAGRFASAERPYMAHAVLESMFPRFIWLSEGRIDTFDITVSRSGTTDTTVTVGAVPVMSVEERKATEEATAHARTATVFPEGTAYLRPGPFYAMGDETRADFTTFVDDAFRSFMDAGARDLILDLRGNPGGDNSFSDPLIAWFADRPFRFASTFRVKASRETRRVLKELAAADPGGVSAMMLDAMGNYDDGDRFAFDIPMAEPRADESFTGHVYALTDRHSYSNATTVAAIIQDYGFGVVIGEETSDLPTSYASSAQFTLPNTGFVITYPKGYFIRPSGDDAVRGVVPDIQLEYPAVPAAGDTVLHRAREVVRSQRESADGS